MPKLARRAESEYELKHRITGAIILVTAVVLIVPLLLSGHSPSGPDSTSDTSFLTDSSSRSRTIPLNLNNVMDPVPKDDSDGLSDSSVEARNRTEENQSAAGNDSSKPALVMTQTSDRSQESPQATVPSREPERSQNEDGWFVRVGTYAKQNNVDVMADLLKKNGYQPRMKSVMTAQGQQSTRIWLGPYVQRDAADSVSERLFELIGEKGYVTGDNS